jgi:predicted O-methyltransferase YrrM
MSWDRFEQLKQSLAAGDAAAVVAPLQELRSTWAEPALATLLADALMRCGRSEDALGCLEADIASGIDNHWTHYCLGHHLAGLGRLPEAAAAFRRCHAQQGWLASEERGYTFTHDYFSGHIANWQRWFAETITTAPIRILEVGSWQGGSTLWLLDHIIGPRGGEITCCDTWEGSSEHTFLEPLGLSLEALFDANVKRTGLSAHVRKLKGYSQDVLPTLPAGSYDLIYIDGAHEAQAVIQDAIHAHRLIAPGGFLLFDDLHYSFADSAQNTANAINFFCRTFTAHYHECDRGAQLLLQRRHCPALPERLLLVLGMHRSGTSALSGLLCNQGFSGPQHPDPADPNNPTGYWEPPAIREVHNSLLEGVQSSWDDLMLPAELWSPLELEHHLQQLEQALQRDFPLLSPNQVALIKDPRQCRLQPLWNDLLRRHRLQAAALLAVRHPLAVALSLQRRDQLTLDRALLLWLSHTLEAERQSRHLPRQVVVYELLLQDPQACLQRIRELVGLPPQSVPAENLAHWIRADLNHAPTDPLALVASSADAAGDPALLKLALSVYTRLVLAHGESISSEDQQGLDQAHADLQHRLRALAGQSSRLQMLQLFWDPAEGGGFCETHSLRCSLMAGRGPTWVELLLPASAAAAQGLRLDPAEEPCVITLHQLQLFDVAGHILWQWQSGSDAASFPFLPLNSYTAFLSDGELVATNHDPALELVIPAADLAQITEGSRLRLQAQWQPLPAHLARRLLQSSNNQAPTAS